jgi:hypothetical protein
MNRRQINHKEMQDSVINFMDRNVDKWTAIPKVGEFKNQLDTVNQQIEQSQEAQQAAQVFLGKSKKELKYSIALKADILNDALESLGAVSGDLALENRMKDSFSDIHRLTNLEFIPKNQEIIREAEAHLDVLQPEYGVTVEQVDDLKADLDNFLQLNGMPRAYQIESVQATKSLEQLFSEASDILTNKLDKVMKIFKRRDPNFYNGYLAARVIVDN